MAYDNSNSGALFKNDDKREGKKDPDYRGQAEVGGVLYWLDAWINESKKDGRKFMSVKFKEKEQRAEKPQKAAPAAAPEFNDDIPF
jgi:uncharacterized protein (DUF736 family)